MMMMMTVVRVHVQLVTSRINKPSDLLQTCYWSTEMWKFAFN